MIQHASHHLHQNPHHNSKKIAAQTESNQASLQIIEEAFHSENLIHTQKLNLHLGKI